MLTVDIAMMLFGAKVDAALHPNRFATKAATQENWGVAGHAMDPSAAEELLEMEDAAFEGALDAVLKDLLEETGVVDDVADGFADLAVA